jgi:mono/diheme cytochrome c family protein
LTPPVASHKLGPMVVPASPSPSFGSPIMRVYPLLAAAICAALFVGLGSTGGAVHAAAAEVDYLREVKPLLAEKCGACHGAVRQKSGLRLDAGKFIHKGGDEGPAIVVGKSGESALVHKLTAAGGESLMPPEGEGKPLTEHEIGLLRRWIDAGAKYPADEPIAGDPREHWSFQPARKAPFPNTKSSAAAAHPIDKFIAAKHDELNLTPSPEADRATLLRRVYLDLIGLPPTRDELRTFLADKSPNAYERVVDQLLARPEHGERWGRHWMDVWRYCDAHGSGNEMRYSQRHLWRWRDWIIRSLNDDKGYDRMITEMLAGDEVAPDDPEIVAATGYIGRNWYKFDRNVWMRELVEHTAVGFLGTTLKCARCHDHKFDPISQEEYYRFRAFFEPHHVRTDRLDATSDYEAFLDGGGKVLKDGLARVYDKTPDEPTYLFERGDDRYPDKKKPLAPGTPQALRGAQLKVSPVSLPRASYAPAHEPKLLDELKRQADAKVAAAEKAAQAAPKDAVAAKRLDHARAERRGLLARIVADSAKHFDNAEPKKCDELAVVAARAEREVAAIQGEITVLEAEEALSALKAKQPQDEKAVAATKAAEAKLVALRNAAQAAIEETKKTDGKYTPIGDVYPTTSSGRRLALARWIADGANPRTARVAVNQIWMRHFGTPLVASVASVADFGLRSKPPTHPELLDWLAVEFVEHGWSMKHLHRLIVTSAAYRRSSVPSGRGTGTNENLAASEIYLAHAPSRRLEAEAVRDAVLAIAGTLDKTIGGREFPYGQDQAVPRRSLYFQTAPNRQSLFLQTFDGASTEECYDRKPSVSPQQSLALMNSMLAATAAKQVAARHAKLNDAEFTLAVFEEVLTRAPTTAESARCGEFLQTQVKRLTDVKKGAVVPVPTGGGVVGDPVTRARESLVLVLFNHNDFITVR